MRAAKASDMAEARARLTDAIASGAAARTAERMIEAQGGDPGVVADRTRLEVAAVEVVVESPADGFVAKVDALAIGLAGVAMGAGRTRADQAVDAGVGILVEKKPGARVGRGEPLARIVVRTEADATQAGLVERIRKAFSVTEGPPPPPRPLVLDRITA